MLPDAQLRAAISVTRMWKVSDTCPMLLPVTYHHDGSPEGDFRTVRQNLEITHATTTSTPTTTITRPRRLTNDSCVQRIICLRLF